MGWDKGSKEKDLRKPDLVESGALRKEKAGIKFGIQLILGQEGGEHDGMKEEAFQSVEMSQRLLRPEELGTRVRSDLSLSDDGHTIDHLPSFPSHLPSGCASTPASCSIFFTVWNSASPQIICGFSYGKGIKRCSHLNDIVLLLLLHLPGNRQV